MQRAFSNIFLKFREGRIVLALLLVSAQTALAPFQASANDAAEPETASMDATAAPDYAEVYGVKIHGIRGTAGDFMMDFRFTVTEPEKARLLFDPGTTPYLEVVKNGARFTVPNPPKVGSLRPTGTPEAGRTYWIFFANPGRYVSRGTELRVVAGDVRIEHLVLE